MADPSTVGELQKLNFNPDNYYDPMYKDKLWQLLAQKGFTNKQIDDYMQRFGIDKKIEQARVDHYLDNYVKAKNGEYTPEREADLARLAYVSAPVASMMAARMPSYLQNWNDTNKLRDMSTTRQYQLEDALRNRGWNVSDAERNRGWQVEDAMRNRGWQVADREYAAAQKANADAQNMERLYQSAIASGATPEQALSFAYSGGKINPFAGSKSNNSGGGTTPKSNAPKQEKMTESDKQTHQSYVNQYNKIFSRLVSNTELNPEENEEVGNLIEQLRLQAEEDSNKGKIDMSYKNEIDQLIRAMLFVRAKKAGYEDEAYQYMLGIDNNHWDKYVAPYGTYFKPQVLRDKG